jgi:hypothetical protein
MTNLNVIRRTTALTGNNHDKREVPVVPMRTTLKLWGGADVVCTLAEKIKEEDFNAVKKGF